MFFLMRRVVARAKGGYDYAIRGGFSRSPNARGRPGAGSRS